MHRAKKAAANPPKIHDGRQARSWLCWRHLSLLWMSVSHLLHTYDNLFFPACEFSTAVPSSIPSTSASSWVGVDLLFIVISLYQAGNKKKEVLTVPTLLFCLVVSVRNGDK